MWTRTLSTTISTSPFRARGSSLAMAGLSHAEFVERPGWARLAGGPDHPDDRRDPGSGHEPPDVLEQGDSAVRGRDAERRKAVDQLEDEPHPQHDQGRHLEQLVEEAEIDQRQDAGPWVEDQVGAEDGGDRPGGADDRDGRRGVDPDLGDRRHRPAEQVEQQEADPAEAVLDVVAEDPEI